MGVLGLGHYHILIQCSPPGPVWFLAQARMHYGHPDIMNKEPGAPMDSSHLATFCVDGMTGTCSYPTVKCFCSQMFHCCKMRCPHVHFRDAYNVYNHIFDRDP